MRTWNAALLVVLLALMPVTGRAQGTTRIIKGVVVATDGRRLAGANVFVLETLEGATADDRGRFQLSIADSIATLVARSVGFSPSTIKVAAPFPDSVVIALSKAPSALTPITVVASSYTASEERTATLTPLEVVTTPGTAADINRALQTLPGIQLVDEGTGLFVRGGDAYETKVFLNDAALLNPIDVQSPNGTFMGTVDPFLLEGIVFSSGGFGARYGNALSAAVSLNTLRRPAKRGLTAGVGLAGISLSIAKPTGRSTGLRLAGNMFDLRPLIALNGSSHDYEPAPKGHDVSASFIASSPDRGELKLFAIQQISRVGIGVIEPSYSGTFGFRTKSDLAVATWTRDAGKVIPTVSASLSRTRKDELYGTFDLDTRLSQAQIFAQAEWARSESFKLRAGGEAEHVGATFEGSIPATEVDVAPGSRTRVLASQQDETRLGVFAEADTRPLSRLRLMTGVRADRSSLTGQSTFDPRLSLAYRAAGSAHITAAWGIYHQVPDPLFFDPSLGNPPLESMSASHAILGFQAGDNARLIRIELYHKSYDNLSRQTRDFAVATDLEGEAYGADLFLRGTLLGIRSRMTYSYAQSKRDDADTGINAASPFDVPHTLTLVLQRYVKRFDLGAAYRFATGRPYTPVTSATFDQNQDRWLPIYGAPSSERLPDLVRVDLSASRLMQLAPGWQIVTYASVNNLFGRHNIYNYTYSSDYRRRVAVSSLFDRSLYVGASILH